MLASLWRTLVQPQNSRAGCIQRGPTPTRVAGRLGRRGRADLRRRADLRVRWGRRRHRAGLEDVGRHGLVGLAALFVPPSPAVIGQAAGLGVTMTVVIGQAVAERCGGKVDVTTVLGPLILGVLVDVDDDGALI